MTKRLSFEYEMILEFDDFISNQQFQLRCVPKDGTYQRVESVAYSIFPTDLRYSYMTQIDERRWIHGKCSDCDNCL